MSEKTTERYSRQNLEKQRTINKLIKYYGRKRNCRYYNNGYSSLRNWLILWNWHGKEPANTVTFHIDG